MRYLRVISKTVFLSILVFLSWSVEAQDLHFSQFYETPLLRNPALAGLYDGDIRIQGIYKNQWNSVSNAFQTGSLNGEYKFKVGKGEDFLTLGGQVLYDIAGSVRLRTINVLPVVNFHKSLSKERISYLSLGFMGGLVNRNIDLSRVNTNNEYDGFSFIDGATGESFAGSFSYADMSVGMSYNTSLGSEDQHLLFGGIAYHHFNKPLNSFYNNFVHPPKWVASAGFKMNINEITYLTFQGDYSEQLPFRKIIFGGQYSRRLGFDASAQMLVHAGMYYRYQDALIPVLKLEMNRLAIGVSYDINTSALASASLNRGGFELSMSWFMNRPEHADIILCPKF